MRATVGVLALGLLAACAPQVPDSASGVGFGDAAARERELAQGRAVAERLIPPSVVSEETLGPVSGGAAPMSAIAGPAGQGDDADIAAATAAALAASSTSSAGSTNVIEEPVQASPDNPAPPVLNQFGISRENDFGAVSQQQSIESDAERIARNRAQYQVVQPTDLPDRPAGGQPNIVNFALSTKHAPGTRVYSRTGLNLESRAERKCAAYPSPDQAQIAFLEKGGPERDRLGLDPDGDGFACSWDPRPFRQAVQN